MKRWMSVVTALLLPMTGCNTLVLVSVGGKTVASMGQMQAPEVQCAALAQPGINGTGINGQIDVQAMKVCEAAVAAQKAIDREKKR